MATGFTIAAVERDVGLSKDVLRVWERRYGFPAPARDAKGERLYPADQVDRLRRIKRLMDQGHRPGRLLTLRPEELDALTSVGTPAAQDDGGDGLAALVGLVRRHEKDAFLQALQQRLAREGLQRFVQDTVAPLAGRIGVDWEEGRLQVFEEHLFTELTGRVLQQAIASVPGGRAPRVLLTTVPNEQHAMGLLMVEAVLALEGATCISLGTQMPLLEIARAAEAHRVDLVALSFSAAFPARQVAGLLHQLRALLPAQVGLWAGGRGVSRATGAEEIRVLHTLDEAVAAVAAWREEPA